REYKSSIYQGSQIKYFYILYLIENEVNMNYIDLINRLEACISEFEVDNTSIVRKMGLSRFKDYVAQKFELKVMK
ncbi:hypothetical protein, partial [Aeromonas jandaei]